MLFRSPGILTKIRSALVNQDSLAKFARSIELGKYIQFGRGEIDSHGGDRDSTVSDAFEALSAAIYLDGGYEAVEKFILDVFTREIPDPLNMLTTLNPKGILQEYAQAEFGKAPTYRILQISGPQHEPCFEVAVTLDGEQLGTGKAQNRKAAEQAAALEAMKVLKERSKEKPS